MSAQFRHLELARNGAANESRLFLEWSHTSPPRSCIALESIRLISTLSSMATARLCLIVMPLVPLDDLHLMLLSSEWFRLQVKSSNGHVPDPVGTIIWLKSFGFGFNNNKNRSQPDTLLRCLELLEVQSEKLSRQRGAPCCAFPYAQCKNTIKQ